MYVVIIGAGKIGVPLAHWTVTAEHEVTLVDRDPVKCAAAEEALGSVALVGDGSEADVLARAGAGRADLLLALTGSDEVNLVSCQLAKHRFGVGRTMAIVNEPEREKLFDILGIGIVVNTTGLIISNIQEQVSGLLVESQGAEE